MVGVFIGRLKDNMIAIIDADSIIWSIAYNFKNIADDEQSIKNNRKEIEEQTDNYINTILSNTYAIEYLGFVKHQHCSTFRTEIYPDYKKGRKIPEFYTKLSPIVIYRLMDKWKFLATTAVEVDDAVSICANHFSNRVICHIDKDLDQIAGTHYNYRSHSHYDISQVQAQKNLYIQVLVGDIADNIKGCPGIGKARAREIIDSSNQVLKTHNGEEIVIVHPIYEPVLDAYVERYGTKEGFNKFTLNFNLVSLLTEDSNFQIPVPVKYNIDT